MRKAILITSAILLTICSLTSCDLFSSDNKIKEEINVENQPDSATVIETKTPDTTITEVLKNDSIDMDSLISK